MAIFGLVGAGGFAREVMPLVRSSGQVYDNLYFVDRVFDGFPVNGYDVQTEGDFLAMQQSRFFNIAIGDSNIREKLAKKYIESGCVPLDIRDRSSIVLDNNQIEEGSILCANTVITSNVKIGKFFHANIFSYVAHDCVIGDFVTFAPAVHCNGNVMIEDHAYIGTGAVLKQGTPEKPLRIGRGAVVGMGAVVTKDVPVGAVVVGNPARPLEQRPR